MESVLKMTNVSYTRSKGIIKKKKFTVEDINIELPYGYICGITGKNGAGKTTLLEAIVDSKANYTGQISVCGMDLKENHVRLNQKIAYLSEDRKFFNERSAIQNAQMLSILYEEFDMEIFKSALDKMKLPQSRNVFEMSRGEFMKFQLAFSMAQKPALYIMDEVTAGMDPVFKVDFFRMVHEIIEDESASVIMITHIEEEITKQMDYIGVMEQGRLVSYKENVPA